VPGVAAPSEVIRLSRASSADKVRRFVAWAGHAPGLWLFYREPIPRALRRPNVVAATATALAVVVAVGLVAPGWRLWVGLTVWAAGHVAWGTYLAWHLPFERIMDGAEGDRARNEASKG
jgi:hypothetical protein